MDLTASTISFGELGNSSANLSSFSYSPENMLKNKTSLFNSVRDVYVAFAGHDTTPISKRAIVLALANLPSQYHPLRAPIEETNKQNLGIPEFFDSWLWEESIQSHNNGKLSALNVKTKSSSTCLAKEWSQSAGPSLSARNAKTVMLIKVMVKFVSSFSPNAPQILLKWTEQLSSYHIVINKDDTHPSRGLKQLANGTFMYSNEIDN